MIHRRLSALALVASGALVVTTTTMLPSFAADADRADASSPNLADATSPFTIIVHLEEGSGDPAARLADAKKRIGDAVAQASPGATMEVVRDYTHAFEGLAIKAPDSALSAIKATQGVAGAFVEGYHDPVTDPDFWSIQGGYGKPADSSDLGAASRMTGAAAASQRGQGQVVEVIDTGVDTSHKAFAGVMDAASLRLTQTDMTALMTDLGAGKNGAWVSDKIPFAYDYGDGDANVIPGSEGGWASEQGTHVAALATANDTALTGAAPGAQLIVAKATRGNTYTANDSALLAALDDAAVLKPDAITVSFATLEGMSTDSVALYSQVYQTLSDQGIVVNAPAGNNENNSYASDPDTGLLGFPAFYPSTLAVASVDEQTVAEQGSQPISVSDFSGTGATYDLRLKPEIAAPGGAVMSASPGNYYGRMSGTAEASAQVAGIATLVRQRVATDPAFAGMSAAEKNAVVTNFLMGTARPMPDATQTDGTFYSPRRVGAGLVDAVGATTSPVYPSVVGAADSSRPKADLGDGTDGWSFQVQLTNVSDAAHTYTLGGQALSEDVQSMLFTGHSTNWAGKGIDLTFSSDSVTVPAKSSVTVTVTVTPKGEFASYATSNTPNGTFIDGAVTFASTDGQPNLTVPYLGFYGSWGAASVFDQQSPNNHKVGFGTTLMSSTLPFGQFNPFEIEDERALHDFNPEGFVITRSTKAGARTRAATGTILLRAVPSLTYTVTNEAGATVSTYTCDRADKAFYDDHWRGMHNVEFMSPGCAPGFDGYDADGNELPDGRYTVTIEAATYGPSSMTQQTSYSFAVDTASPVISNVAITGEGDAATLSFDVTDASPIAGFGFKATPDGALTLWKEEEYLGQRADDGLFHEHYHVKIVDVRSQLGVDPATIYLYAWDWAKNEGTTTAAIKPVAMTSLSVSPALVSLVVGESVTLSVSHEPVDATVTSVVWSSSDEAVATVSADDVVSAVGAGDATITVADPTQPSVMASATIHVNAPVPAPKAGVWKWSARGWWYRYEDGSYPSSTALVIDGSTYRFDAAGYMRTGWVKDQGAWYYHEASGAQASGWVFSGARWYYLSPDSGVMVTGWVQVGSTWYYLNPSDGAMATGWLKEGGYWYYLQPGSGAMVTGWLKIWGTWYHFADNGQLIS